MYSPPTAKTAIQAGQRGSGSHRSEAVDFLLFIIVSIFRLRDFVLVFLPGRADYATEQRDASEYFPEAGHMTGGSAREAIDGCLMAIQSTYLSPIAGSPFEG